MQNYQNKITRLLLTIQYIGFPFSILLILCCYRPEFASSVLEDLSHNMLLSSDLILHDSQISRLSYVVYRGIAGKQYDALMKHVYTCSRSLLYKLLQCRNLAIPSSSPTNILPNTLQICIGKEYDLLFPVLGCK